MKCTPSPGLFSSVSHNFEQEALIDFVELFSLVRGGSLGISTYYSVAPWMERPCLYKKVGELMKSDEICPTLDSVTLFDIRPAHAFFLAPFMLRIEFIHQTGLLDEKGRTNIFDGFNSSSELPSLGCHWQLRFWYISNAVLSTDSLYVRIILRNSSKTDNLIHLVMMAYIFLHTKSNIPINTQYYAKNGPGQKVASLCAYLHLWWVNLERNCLSCRCSTD